MPDFFGLRGFAAQFISMSIPPINSLDILTIFFTESLLPVSATTP